jgi:hypothetical protein
LGGILIHPEKIHAGSAVPAEPRASASGNEKGFQQPRARFDKAALQAIQENVKGSI